MSTLNASTPHRRVILAGATGLVGRELLAGLLADPSVGEVHALVRRPLTQTHAKLQVHVVDFAALPRLPVADEVYLALGTTIKVAGSQAAFRAVDFDANLAVAKAALKANHQAGATRAGLVSAMGADARSAVFYNRVKGELEQALSDLPLHGLVIARPSMLVGDRAQLGQPVRRGEEWANAFGQRLGFLIPANYKPIKATAVARALLGAVPTVRGKRVMLSGELRSAAR